MYGHSNCMYICVCVCVPTHLSSHYPVSSSPVQGGASFLLHPSTQQSAWQRGSTVGTGMGSFKGLCGEDWTWKRGEHLCLETNEGWSRDPGQLRLGRKGREHVCRMARISLVTSGVKATRRASGELAEVDTWVLQCFGTFSGNSDKNQWSVPKNCPVDCGCLLLALRYCWVTSG